MPKGKTNETKGISDNNSAHPGSLQNKTANCKSENSPSSDLSDDIIRIVPIGDKFMVSDENNEFILTHLGNPFPAMGHDMASVLRDDLLIEPAPFEDRLLSSLVYCMLSTMTESHGGKSCGDPECRRDHSDFHFEIEEMIQWDQAYRLLPSPEYLLPQRRAIAPLVSFLEDDYEDLPLNYASSVEEMKINNGWEPYFVKERVINKFRNILDSFTKAQRFSILLLNNAFTEFSVSLSIMLVGKMITADQYFLAWHSLVQLKKSDRFSPKQKTELAAFKARLNNLYRALESEDIKQFI